MTEARPFYIDCVSPEKIFSPVACFGLLTPCHSQRLSCQIGRGVLSIDAHGCGPACRHNWAAPWHDIPYG